MGWSIGWDSTWKRDIGYGVPAVCDQPRCKQKIDRGLAYVCGGEPYGGDEGCGLYFCASHLYFRLGTEAITYPQQCKRCSQDGDYKPYKAKADAAEWIKHKLTDPSWKKWRDKNPADVSRLKAALP